MQNVSKKKKIKAWLELIRLPNLLTIPGDILAGYFILIPLGTTFGFELFVLCFISLLLYSSGLIINDICDLKEDQKDRPNRPLASGVILQLTALRVVCICVLFALFLAFCISLTTFFTTVILTALIVFYNMKAREKPQIAFGCMGLCRGLNFLLGASVFGFAYKWELVIPFTMLTVYIYAVTAIAYNETKALPTGFTKWLPYRTVLIAAFFFCVFFDINFAAIMMAVIAVFYVFNITKEMNKYFPVQKMPPQIGKFIRGLILLQSMIIFCTAPEYFEIAGGILLLLPISSFAGKMFYSS